MSIQDQRFPPVNFSIASPLQTVRLLEIPLEVADLIEASRNGENRSTRFKFKSAPPPGEHTSQVHNAPTKEAQDSVLHLCSDEKSWAVRQVSTSNSVYLIQPTVPETTTGNLTSTVTAINDHDRMDDGSQALSEARQGGVTAIAQIGNFLELQPVNSSDVNIANAISRIVPVYDTADDDEDGLGVPNRHEVPIHSVDQLIDDIACPDRVARQICARMCLFESPTPTPCCYIPSHRVLLQVWERIIESCAIELIPLDHAIDADRIINVLEDATHQAIAGAMLRQGGMLDSLGLFESSLSKTATTGSSSGSTILTTEAISVPSEPNTLRYIHPRSIIMFVACLLLSAAATDQPTQSTHNQNQQREIEIDATSFFEKWTNLVPAAFVKFCNLKDLDAIAHVSVSTGLPTSASTATSIPIPNTSATASDEGNRNQRIRFQPDVLHFYDGLPFTTDGSSFAQTQKQNGTAGGAKTVTATAAAAASGTARAKSWHERFWAQKMGK